MAADAAYERFTATMLMHSPPGEYATLNEIMRAVRNTKEGGEQTEAELRKMIVQNRQARYASVAAEVGATLDDLEWALRSLAINYKPVPTDDELRDKLKSIMSLHNPLNVVKQDEE